ncbi:hypothetical protein [Halocalculus aciditolerans]|uniref:Uncharacterized protein n=1 Tax=Halocalculus aciditolerans TaxID=1383812 RepID=A0A830F175_9EURY|nr:hypothetical protein [Halocalculus aciditolerans]GGL51374.1 hypothetical protein GCM10009039_07080 [Halocalculus aciditolerans]
MPIAEHRRDERAPQAPIETKRTSVTPPISSLVESPERAVNEAEHTAVDATGGTVVDR